MARINLRPGPENALGTNGDDLFIGGANTLQTGDLVVGNAGDDRLVADVVQNGPQAPTIRGVETLWLDTGGLPFDLTNVTEAEQVGADGTSIIIQQIGTPELAWRYAARNVESGTVKLQFEDGVLEGMNDTLDLLATASNVTFTSDSVFDSTADGEQNQTEDRLRIEAIDLRLFGRNDQAEFDNQVDLSDFGAIETLRLAGDAKSKIVVDSPELATINAAATKGGITLTSDIAGDQTVQGGSGDDDLKTGAGDDTVRGNAGDDVLTVGGGDNVVVGGSGDDEITSEQGADLILGGTGDDTIDSGSGDDNVRGQDGDDDIVAGDGADLVRGGAGADTIDGGGGADRIFDGAGNDTVRGGNDNDILFMGQGNDTVFGEGGQDIFFFRGSNLGTDTVRDFQLTSNAATNDAVFFDYQGGVQQLDTQEEFQRFADRNPNAVTVDNSTSTITIDADGGTIRLNVSDADFLML